MTIATTTVTSPLGTIQLAATERGLSGVWFDQRRHAPLAGDDWVDDSAPFVDVVRQLEEYFAGARRRFDVGLDQQGTEFQHRVWDALGQIPYGETISYGELARRAGRPAAARAAGAANGRNQISIIVPCHRVVGAAGHLTDFGGGLERKRQLLDLEAAGSGRL